MTDKQNVYPNWLIEDLRTDHAGETGAVAIYKGILAVSRDAAVRQFALRHMETEKKHLEEIGKLLKPGERTKLIPLWRVAGWLTGALPAIFGSLAVHATIDAVETFVDEHYREQIERLDRENIHPEIRDLLEQCRLDEVEHRDEARELHRSDLARLLKVWCKLVDSGSRGAVSLSRTI